MPAPTIRARSLPYHVLRRTERICTRCGIQYQIRDTSRDGHLTKCRDCRGMT